MPYRIDMPLPLLTIRANLWQGVEQYTGRTVSNLELCPDRIEGTYAMRATYVGETRKGEFLIVGYVSQNREWISMNLEEVEFKTWPPTSK